MPDYEGDALATLETHWTFILNNNDRMRYATLRANGLPCASGATEGACKSVVMIRAKGCGNAGIRGRQRRDAFERLGSAEKPQRSSLR